MVDSGTISVRWVKLHKGPTPPNNVNATPSRKRFATRDQPTWINCKLRRPSRAGSNAILNGDEVICKAAEWAKGSSKSAGSHRSTTSLTTQSSRLFSAKSSFSKATTSSSTNAIESTPKLSMTGSVENQSSNGDLSNDGRHGRCILIKKGKETLMAFNSKYYGLQCNGSATKCKSEDLDTYHSLRKFRISSAESVHRSPDVSIGLRHISRMLSLSSNEPNRQQSTHKKRSANTLQTLVKITSQNLHKNKRQSQPIIPDSPPQHSDENWRELGPGERETREQRRRSSTTSATKGEGSIPSHPKPELKLTRPRPMPEACVSSPYSTREWRPSALNKYSTKQPWAPIQQTARYFPRYANLQDVHCRNPYAVPGSILYKPLPTDPR